MIVPIVLGYQPIDVVGFVFSFSLKRRAIYENLKFRPISDSFLPKPLIQLESMKMVKPKSKSSLRRCHEGFFRRILSEFLRGDHCNDQGDADGIVECSRVDQQKPAGDKHEALV